MTKTLAQLRADPRVSTLEPQDGSADDEYRYYLALKPGWALAGYGGQGKHVRTVKEAARLIQTAEREDFQIISGPEAVAKFLKSAGVVK